MTTKLINLCPHAINVLDDAGKPVLTVQPSGELARVSQTEEVVAIPDLPCVVTRQTLGTVTGLHDVNPGVFLIVSRLVAAACPEGDDLLIPGPLVRDDAGNPIGCRGLSVL